MRLMYGHDDWADGLFREAMRDTFGYISGPRNSFEREQRRNHIIATMLAERHNSKEVETQRALLHVGVVEEAMKALQYQRTSPIRSPQVLATYAGPIAEHTVTGLLTRYRHPWMLAVPALEHHDMARVVFDDADNMQTRNFDTVLVETGPGQVTNNPHRIQTKLGCIGVCSRPKQRTIDRNKYAPEITLASAHCDLGVGVSQTNGEWDSPLTDLLVKEVIGTATDEDIATLDRATDTLLLNLTAPIGERCGTWQE